MRVFVSYKFDDKKTVAQAVQVREFIEKLGYEYVDGRNIRYDAELNPQLKDLISTTEKFIALHNSEMISEYLISELSFAASEGCDIVIVTNTMDSLKGLHPNLPLLLFKDDLSEVVPALVKALYDWRLSAFFGSTLMDSSISPSTDNAEIIDKLSELRVLDSSTHKKDLRYTITLHDMFSEELPDFFKATISISYRSIIPSETLTIRAKKSLQNAHKVYNDMLRDRKSVYRYIIKAPPTFDLENDHFKVKSFKIGEYELEGTPLGSRDEIEHTFDASEVINKTAERKEPPVFQIEIETIVAKDQNEFTMIFGYPVNSIAAEFHYEKTDIRAVDVIDVFSSRENTTKVFSMARKSAGASAYGWVLPESAIVFVWRREA